MAIEEVLQVRKVEWIIENHLAPVRFIGTYRDTGDVFAEVYDEDDHAVAEFNVTELATEIVRELARIAQQAACKRELGGN